MATVTNYYTTTFSASLNANVGRAGVNETFSTIRGGAGNTSASSISSGVIVDLLSSTTTNQFNSLYRGIILFNTSSIPVGATIISATLNIPISAKDSQLGTDTLEVVSSNPASTSAVVNADYSTLGSTSFASVSYASVTTPQTVSITLNSSGRANITPNGISKFGLRLGWDLNNSFTGSWGSVRETYYLSSTWANTLTVNYSVDFPTLSINNISSLSNVTTITTS